MRKNLTYFFSTLFCLISFFALSQKPKGQGGQQIQSQMQTVRGDTCLDKKFSVVVYLIQDSINSLTTPSLAVAALNAYSLTQTFLQLNQKFSNVCVSFEHCKTVIIPNWTFNLWSTRRNGINAIRDYNTENTICLYIPDSILLPFQHDPPYDDYAYHADTIAPFRNAIVVQKRHVMRPAMYHAVGHFFGLPHTYAEINPTQATIPPTPASVTTREFVDKSNSYTHGDGFADTEADPWPTAGPGPSSDANCVPTFVIDGKGNYYTPPFDNYMSRYLECACKYSKEQYHFMVHYMMKKRLYLH